MYYKDISLVSGYCNVLLLCLQTALGDNKWLQHKLIESLVEFDDLDEAARWTMFYCLPLDTVPQLVKEVIDSW